MRHVSRIINSIAIIVAFAYLFLTRQIYSLFINVSGNLTDKIYTYSKIPYYLLWIGFIISIVTKLIRILSNDKKNLVVIYLSEVLVMIFLIATFIFTPSFEFLYYDKKDIYPESYRFDKMFVYNKFYSNEGDYEGGYGDTKYFYVPVIKRIYFIKNKDVISYDVKFLNKEKVRIGDKDYSIKPKWFTES